MNSPKLKEKLAQQAQRHREAKRQEFLHDMFESQHIPYELLRDVKKCTAIQKEFMFYNQPSQICTAQTILYQYTTFDEVRDWILALIPSIEYKGDILIGVMNSLLDGWIQIPSDRLVNSISQIVKHTEHYPYSGLVIASVEGSQVLSIIDDDSVLRAFIFVD